MPPTQADRSDLANALLNVKHALEAANICLTGTETIEQDQYAANGQAIYLLAGKIHQVIHGSFKMQTGLPGWKAAAKTLRENAEKCTAKPTVISGSQALIAMVPLHNI